MHTDSDARYFFAKFTRTTLNLLRLASWDSIPELQEQFPSLGYLIMRQKCAVTLLIEPSVTPPFHWLAYIPIQ